MRTLKLLTLAACALVFSQCKTMAPTAPTGSEPSLLEVQQILDTTASKFLEYADSTAGNPWKAIMLTANWVESQPNVQSVSTVDSSYLDITLKSGLQTNYFFNMVDGNGYSIFRGGGGQHPEPAHVSFSNLSKNTIENKKVLIYAPAWTEFDLQSSVPNTVSTLENSAVGLDVTVLKDEACTPAMANTFKDYGLVIIDTHGMRDAFMSGVIIDISKNNNTQALYKAAVILQAGQDIYDGLLSNDFTVSSYTSIPTGIPNWQKRKNLKRIDKIYITTQFIKKMPSLSKSVIFGNMCYSGYSVTSANITYPIKTAFMDKDPISYYGYALANGKATVVTDAFSKDMEDSLSKRLANDLDSTGRAHLRPSDGTEFNDIFLDGALYLTPPDHIHLLMKHFGADDYSYQGCVSEFTDARDGQKYKAVCIGKQNWMAQNLNYNAPGSVTYNNDPANGAIYGRLYNFATMLQGAAPSSANPSKVQGICPKGWHVPSDAEFDELFGALDGDEGGAMKSTSSLWNSPNLGATNSSGFSALPGGFNSDLTLADAFLNIGYSAIFGTTTAMTGGGGNWSCWGILADSKTLDGFGEFQKGAVSCRCVKDN